MLYLPEKLKGIIPVYLGIRRIRCIDDDCIIPGPGFSYPSPCIRADYLNRQVRPEIRKQILSFEQPGIDFNIPDTFDRGVFF
jgi:hypothetical protein